MSATSILATHKKLSTKTSDMANPQLQQKAPPTQRFGTVLEDSSIGLDSGTREKVCTFLNPILADTMSLRDLYKKSHWQVEGPTFYQLHLLFDEHFKKQSKLIDLIAERIQTLGGLAVSMAADVADMTRITKPPSGREEVPVIISRLLEAHQAILMDARSKAKEASSLGDLGTNDLLVADVVRTNEFQSWFLSSHLVNMPLVDA